MLMLLIQVPTADMTWDWHMSPSCSTLEPSLCPSVPPCQECRSCVLWPEAPNKTNPTRGNTRNMPLKLQEGEGLMSTESFLCARHRPDRDREIKACLPSLGSSLLSVGCSMNFSSGDLDLCMVGRVGSLNSMVSLPPVMKKGKMDILCHEWSCGYTDPPRDGLAMWVNKAPSSVVGRG